MKLLLSLLCFTFLGASSQAAPKRLFQDIKLPTQKVLEAQTWTTPSLNGSTDMLSQADGPSSAAAATITTFVAQPDYARNLVMANVAPINKSEQLACIVTVAGTNTNGHAISETFTFSSNTLSILTGAKAFKTVTSVSFPASCEGGTFGMKYDLGWGVLFGLKRCMTNVGDVFKELTDGANVSVGTYLANATAVESNTAAFTTAQVLGATHSYTNYFVQNYQCY